MTSQSDFKFTDKDFNFIRELVSEKAGIKLADGKRQLVYSRLSRRLRQLGLPDFKAYCGVINEDGNPEFVNFINAITTNLTSFFREQHHFDFLKGELFPFLAKKNQDTRKIRVWSAGCSTGEEPYSIAMTFRDHFPSVRNWDVKILATDLDTNVLAHAKKGVYDAERVSSLDSKIVKKWFKHGSGENEEKVKVHPGLQELITFKHLNLMESWPIKGKFDLIFCRNVIIYFDKPTQRVLIERYSNQMASNGHLLLGHSESLFKVSDKFDLLGHTIYKKKE